MKQINCTCNIYAPFVSLRMKYLPQQEQQLSEEIQEWISCLQFLLATSLCRPDCNSARSSSAVYICLSGSDSRWSSFVTVYTFYYYNDKYLHYKFWERRYLMYLGTKECHWNVNVNNDKDFYSCFVHIVLWVLCLSSSRYMQQFKYNTNKRDQYHGTSGVQNAPIQHFEITSKIYSSIWLTKCRFPTTCLKFKKRLHI